MPQVKVSPHRKIFIETPLEVFFEELLCFFKGEVAVRHHTPVTPHPGAGWVDVAVAALGVKQDRKVGDGMQISWTKKKDNAHHKEEWYIFHIDGIDITDLAPFRLLFFSSSLLAQGSESGTDPPDGGKRGSGWADLGPPFSNFTASP